VVAFGLLAAGSSHAVAALAAIGISAIGTTIDDLVVDPWKLPIRLGSASGAILAVVLVGPDRATLATLLIVIGAMAVVWSARLRHADIGVIGGLLVTGGIWLHLLDHAVRASEPYLAPVAALMVIAGWQARRAARLSSWVAYGPAVALLGGSALAERVAGGGAGHALMAGGVCIVAVVVGGGRRLIAPLLLGTGLLVTLTVHESLGVTAGVPTWAWLGLGGATLIAAGIAMERSETGPLETGRRVVDVVGERFS
jgi:hypothetical protein